MSISYINGNFLPHDEICISPDDRGFLFADGVYEVVRWYQDFFFEMGPHLTRLRRSLNELNIRWDAYDSFPVISKELIKKNNLTGKDVLVYLQVTRGASARSHSFPAHTVRPTVYAFAREHLSEAHLKVNGIGVMLKNDIRWSRCDIKSIALLPNTLSFQEAVEKKLQECVFVRDGLITEGSHSNIFFVIDNILYTHPESNYILSGITRNYILKIARQNGISIKENAVNVSDLKNVDEAFISNTSSEVMPVTVIGDTIIGDGLPGPVTRLLQAKFEAGVLTRKQ